MLGLKYFLNGNFILKIFEISLYIYKIVSKIYVWIKDKLELGDYKGIIFIDNLFLNWVILRESSLGLLNCKKNV